MTPELVVVGNLAVDDIVYPDGTTRMGQPGGACIYVALGASLWGTRVGIVSRVGTDYPAEMIKSLESQGVDLSGIHNLGTPGLRTWLLYEGDLRRVVHQLGSATHTEASPTIEDFPEGWASGSVHIAPLPMEIQYRLVGALAGGSTAQLSMDPYELIDKSSLDSWKGLVRRVDHLFVSEDEMAEQSWRSEPQPILKQLFGGKLCSVVYKQGSKGGVAMDCQTSNTMKWEARCRAVVDQTGAGDAFAGGTLAGLIFGDDMSAAIERGVVSASFAIETRGASGLLDASPDRAVNRLREWFGRP